MTACIVLRNMYNLKKMQENVEKLSSLGIKVEVGDNCISVFKYSADHELYFFHNYYTVEEFNVFCEVFARLIDVDGRLFELIALLRKG